MFTGSAHIAKATVYEASLASAALRNQLTACASLSRRLAYSTLKQFLCGQLCLLDQASCTSRRLLLFHCLLRNWRYRMQHSLERYIQELLAQPRHPFREIRRVNIQSVVACKRG